MRQMLILQDMKKLCWFGQIAAMMMNEAFQRKDKTMLKNKSVSDASLILGMVKKDPTP